LCVGGSRAVESVMCCKSSAFGTRAGELLSFCTQCRCVLLCQPKYFSSYAVRSVLRRVSVMLLRLSLPCIPFRSFIFNQLFLIFFSRDLPFIYVPFRLLSVSVSSINISVLTCLHVPFFSFSLPFL
jgi:hypothetical protein